MTNIDKIQNKLKVTLEPGQKNQNDIEHLKKRISQLELNIARIDKYLTQ